MDDDLEHYEDGEWKDQLAINYRGGRAACILSMAVALFYGAVTFVFTIRCTPHLKTVVFISLLGDGLLKKRLMASCEYYHLLVLSDESLQIWSLVYGFVVFVTVHAVDRRSAGSERSDSTWLI